jgi:hypothetical protein
MKYWKNFKGDCGTMDNDGFVPDSTKITKEEYDRYVKAQPIINPVNQIIEYENIETGKILKLRKVK